MTSDAVARIVSDGFGALACRKLFCRKMSEARTKRVILLGLVLAIWIGEGLPALRASPPSRSLSGAVVRVVDGDTIHVRINGRVEKVRYIGVNTPEIHHPTKGEEPGGREASEVNGRLVTGRHVRLQLDVQARHPYRP